jgi:hypothetical protein
MGDDDLVETSRLPRGDDVKSWRSTGRAGRFRGFGSKRGSLHSATDIQELVVDQIHSTLRIIFILHLISYLLIIYNGSSSDPQVSPTIAQVANGG